MILSRSLALSLATVSGNLTLSGVLLFLHPSDPGLIAITVQLLLLLIMLGTLWMVRPLPTTSPVPAPPWGRVRHTPPGRPKAYTVARWMLVCFRLREALIDTPPAPSARPIPPQRRRTATKAPPPPRSNWRRLQLPFKRPIVTIPLPTLDIEFVAPGRRQVHQVNEPLSQSSLLQITESVLVETLAAPRPALLALHDQPRQLTLQLATTVLLTTAQQRAIIEGMREQGVVAVWSDIARLAVRREALRAEQLNVTHASDVLWVPVVNQRQTTTWWPLPRQQHLLIAGHFAAPLTGLLQRVLQQQETNRPQLLIHDPDGRLRDLDDHIGRLVAQPDALNQARQLQLHYRFIHERETRPKTWVPPLCLVVEPTEHIWPEVQPLLDAESGVQVVLVLGHLPPITPLRALCYRLPVIEIAQALTPPLPETFRPAGVPMPRPGQAVAWMLGGNVWWRGHAPEVADTTEAP